jgi:putative RNA 2'-phosphotransferase
MNPEDKSFSKTLSLILRHNPNAFGLELDAQGWCKVEELLAAVNTKKRENYSLEDLKRVVRENDKQRFHLSEDNARIRANQGHSIAVEHLLTEKQPPEVLFHGTTEKNLASIKSKGLLKMKRHHVHLSADTETAKKVGSRHGKPVILRINAAAMHQNGHAFFISKNGVWLTDHVPSAFIGF